jgi:hypothetical protein
VRTHVDPKKLRLFMEEIGRTAQSPGRIYLVGGATALLLNFREQTVDIDLKLDPEPKGVFEAIAKLKDQLDVNVELASPDDFLPALPGWHERSEFIARFGQVEFYHYDFYAQALSKILRWHEQDIQDARALIKSGKVDPEKLQSLFEEIQSELIRFPSISPDDLKRKLRSFVEEVSR